MPWSKWPQSRSGSGLHSVDDNMVIMESSFPSVEKCFIIKYGLLLCTDFVVDPNHASKMNLTVEQPLFFPFHFSVYIELWGSCAVIGICGIKWIGWNWIGLNYRAWKPRIIFLSFTRVCTVPKYNPPPSPPPPSGKNQPLYVHITVVCDPNHYWETGLLMSSHIRTETTLVLYAEENYFWISSAL